MFFNLKDIPFAMTLLASSCYGFVGLRASRSHGHGYCATQLRFVAVNLPKQSGTDEDELAAEITA
jgi:hypothetical protein